MALSDPHDTLAYHASRVVTSHRDMSHVPVSSVTERLKHFMGHTKTDTCPQAEALWFYGLNHGMALIGQNFDSHEPLPNEELAFVNNYHTLMSEKAVRAFYYLLLICTREARHVSNIKADKPKLAAECGDVMANFMTSGAGEHGIHENLMANPPKVTIGKFVKTVRWMFYNMKWPGGYGGKAWGKVTDCLVNFVTGTFSAEMMLDTIWTLAHNNGPIFNKGHLYAHHSSTALLRILDVQRSGQIPQGVVGDEVLGNYASPELKAMMLVITDKYGLHPYVDWHTVEALGAVGTYYSDKKKQDLAGLGTPEGKAAAEAAAKKALAASQKKAQEEAEYKANHIEVIPGFTVKKIAIKRAA